MGKHTPHHDLEDPQNRRRFLWAKLRIRSLERVHLIPTRRWFHGPPLFGRRQKHNQTDFPLAQQRYYQVPPRPGRTTHEKIILDHAHAWKILTSDTPGGYALLLTLPFSFIFIPLVPLEPLTNL